MTEATDVGCGYTQPGYVASLAEFGMPTRLPRSGGWLLERPIRDTGHRDFMGPYPLFACSDWTQLGRDLDDLAGLAVSVVLVADPLASVDPDVLRTAFPDRVVLFKHHLVRDVMQPAPLPSHHRRHLRRAARSVEVEVVRQPVRYLKDWTGLYAALVAKHGLRGIRAFSPDSFSRQLSLPGMLAVRADIGGDSVAMALWLVDGERAYYHLGASSDAGRSVGASYAVFDRALDHLGECGVRLVDFGGVAGGEIRNDGLSRFKAGWANGQRPTYLCGRVLAPAPYAALTASIRAPGSWFPAYRAADPDASGP
ncbi:Acetyltransferase (GNAT) domain-containing protein [Geodermatophilus amargosae]|uniref:Acetyltransferase (GNAT) domain-containing protein n=1 Tax=Geodermatophilus amargosae TaxID=1296565 RepID=A0A1I6X6R4_9ACTN|nr:GNAT family N-acetyltransferase [Geodermatophilus amargosae]SFT33876.1 Acetyltransferase (GNAT) domain-containing protein [Geodermatophilus amargosae]